MDDKEVFNPQSGERIAPKKPKKFWKDWRFYVYTIIAVMLAIVSVSSMVTACAAINAGVGQSEPVSTQYKVKHNEQIYTDEAGFTGYKMSFSASGRDSANNKAVTNVYQISTSNWSASPLQLSGMRYDQAYQKYCWYDDNVYTWQTFVNVVNQRYNDAKSNEANDVRLIHTWGAVDWGNWGTDTYIEYWSFVAPAQALRGFSFVYITPSWTTYEGLKLDAYETAFGTNQTQRVILTYAKTGYFLIDTTRTKQPDGEYYFQDVESYYKELGYQTGYEAGYENGHDTGFDDGYADGNDFGYSNGYAEGYDAGETHAYDTLKTGIAFETYGMYSDATFTLVADRALGSYYYMDLFDYVTDTNIERSVYVLYTQNSNTSNWFGYVQDVNASDSSGATYDIGSFSGASSTTDVVFTALMDRNLWEGAYITSFHGRAEVVNNAFWFTGGSYAATQQIYQDGYGDGYDVGRNDGYDLGYDAGVQVGRTQGLNEAEPESLTNTLVAVFQQPFNQLYRFFNFNVLGLNVLGIVSGLISVLVVLKVFKKLYK